jgi:hypothetical protein
MLELNPGLLRGCKSCKPLYHTSFTTYGYWLLSESGKLKYTWKEYTVEYILKMSKQWRNKRSTNVPQTFRYLIGMKPKRLSSSPNLSYRKRTFLFLSRRADSVPNWNNLFSMRQFRERYKNVLVSLQNDIGTFVLSFLIHTEEDSNERRGLE